MKRLSEILFSVKTTLFLLAILGIGAAVATFLENDYGTSTARVLVYYSCWYEGTMLLAGVNLAGVIFRYRMWSAPPRFLFHLAFLVILAGSAITHFFGQEGILHIREGAKEKSMLSMEPYLQVDVKRNGKSFHAEFQKDFSAIGNNRFTEEFGVGNRKIVLDFLGYDYFKKGSSGIGVLRLNLCLDNECKDIALPGQRGAKGVQKHIKLGDADIDVVFGSKTIDLPFEIKLRDFQLERYPGSMAPSSYASEVTVVDSGKSFDYRIFMNHTLDYRGYKFFQSSYDTDEKGTILSVNDDPGKWPTYLGYFLLALGLLWNLFDPKSRFGKLVSFLGSGANVMLPVLLFSLSTSLFASGQAEKFENYVAEYAKESLAVSDAFGKLIVQAPMGRMEPINTLNTQLLYKIHGSTSFKGMNQDQVMLGMFSRPELWRDARLIKIKSPKLKKILNIPPDRKYISFGDIFKDGKYVLKKHVEESNRISPSSRGTFEREVIALDEKLNVIYMVFTGRVYRIFPLQKDPSRRWYSPDEAFGIFKGIQKKAVQYMTVGLIESVDSKKWDTAMEMLKNMRNFQYKYGADIIPPSTKVKAELLYNRLHIFPRFVPLYLLTGLILLVVGFAEIIKKNPNRYFERFRKISWFLLLAYFALHTFGLGLRWYVSGHAPWSDAYESLLYISWSSLLAGLIFFRRSSLVLAATVLIAGIFVFTAHLSNINPQITNLVPVLKSYWLTIHVSVITASYGFLGLGALLGYIVLLLFVLRSSSREHVDRVIYRLVAVIEASLIIGLSMLTIGNFIGGVWANESWGRYWGWDPKETWAYISIIVYTIVLHLRLISRLDRPFVLAVASFVAFASILMTYFGVNFYLSGMHSYATGDPVPIPAWVWWVTGIGAATIAAAWPRRDLPRIRLANTKASRKNDSVGR